MTSAKKIIYKYRLYVAYAVIIVVSLVLMANGDASKISGFRALAVEYVGKIQSAFNFIPNSAALKSENQALRKLNMRLSNELTKTREAVIENQKLRTLLKLKDKFKQKAIVAEVVGKINLELRNYYTLDKGSLAGVKVGMPIRSDAGLAGRIVAVEKNYSLAELIANRNYKIAAAVQRTRINGILVWKGEDSFSLKDIFKNYDVTVGDTVITSYLSGKFPPEIPIGYVSSVSNNPGDLFLDVEVKFFANLETLEQVFVILYQPDPERLKLIKEYDELLKNRKKTAR